MGSRGAGASAKFVKARRPPQHRTRSSRQRKQRLLRAGVWIFLLLFALGTVGALFAVGTIK